MATAGDISGLASSNCTIDHSGNAPCTLKLPEEGDVLAPYVKIWIVKAGTYITVGNDSSPDIGNRAIIKDFEFGQSNSLTCKITIHDQQGSKFEQFVQDLIRDYDNLIPAGALTLKAQWGWIKSGCQTTFSPNFSPVHIMSPLTIMCNFSHGKFVFDITAVDLTTRMLEGRAMLPRGVDAGGGTTNETGGGNMGNMPLKQALRELFTDQMETPCVSGVEFKKIVGKSSAECNFREKGKDGQSPDGVWSPEGRDKLNAARAWINSHPTENDKGWVMAYDSTRDVIIFWEDSLPKCGEVKSWEDTCIGTYIVNGSKDSPVLEFNPMMNWAFNAITSAGGAMAGKKVMIDEDLVGHNRGECATAVKSEDDKNLTAGVSTHITEDRVTRDAGKTMDQKALDIAKDAKANPFTTFSIESDLVLIGDPKLLPPVENISRNLAIVFINPFYILENDTTCGEWLAQPTCNAVLSNRGWMCRKISHKISPGRYTTTMRVFLAAPGIDIASGSPFGADTNGWNPTGG